MIDPKMSQSCALSYFGENQQIDDNGGAQDIAVRLPV